MKLLSLLICFSCLVFGSAPAFSQNRDKSTSASGSLSARDETETWQYPYKAPEEKRQKLLAVLDAFKDPEPIGDLIRNLGTPDRIDDLTKMNKPLSHYEDGFMARSKDTFSYRCIWFARKESKSPGLSDSWLAAYIARDEKTVLVMHQQLAPEVIHRGDR
jgi:hypothetical protein